MLNIANQAEFSEKVLNSTVPVLVDFWAPWCGPCKMIAPELEAVAADYEGKALIAKVNVDDNPQLASQFSVSGIPTMLVFKNGKETNRMVGFRPRNDIKAAIDKAL